MRALMPKYLTFSLAEKTLDLFCTGSCRISTGGNQWKEIIATLRTYLLIEQPKSYLGRSRSLISNIGTPDTVFL